VPRTRREIRSRDIEAKTLEIRAKREIATGYTAVGFVEAAATLEARVAALEEEVALMRREGDTQSDELLDLIGADSLRGADE